MRDVLGLADPSHRDRLRRDPLMLLEAPAQPAGGRPGHVRHHEARGDHIGGGPVPAQFEREVPPLRPETTPWLAYPSRGLATLWTQPPDVDASTVVALIGKPRARLLAMLDEPFPTIELARRLRVTPSAVSQQLRVLRTARLVTRMRSQRHVMYHRTDLGTFLLSGRCPD